ncbi:YjgN family protein [Psychrobacter lutiphocae]|uniref:YjgN family protein n=1 Tax=Psychrobacter lutiphocae TaxID=540500 RepID=UPI0012EA0AD9|nr:YjgN family protein [Psychrobacter lutiphocae]
MKQVKFNGSGDEYFKIWIVNVLLSIVTFGIYYPWAKVRTRRYFYANTEYAGRFFDYHATGKQLFLGYLIGVVILIVIQVISFIVPAASIILPIVLFAVIPWIVWRSLQFNMRMTSFSNVRFGFIGQLKTAYFVYMLLPILGYLAVIGLIVIGFGSMTGFSGISGSTDFSPIGVLVFILASIFALVLSVYMAGLFIKKSTEYQIGHTKFGQGRFLIDVDTKTFAKIALKTGLIAMATVGVFVLIFGLIFGSVVAGSIDDPENVLAMFGFIFGFMIAYFGFIAASLFIAAYSYSRQRQYIFANTTLDERIHFKSTVAAKSYFVVLITNMLLVLFSAGLATPWAKVRVAQYLADNTWIDADDMDINQYLTNKQNEQSAIGEEIGDVLDIDINIAI